MRRSDDEVELRALLTIPEMKAKSRQLLPAAILSGYSGHMFSKSVFGCLVAILCTSGAARAQEQGASVGGNVSVLNMDSNNSASYAGAFDYRFSRVVGLEIEITYAPSLKSQFPDRSAQALTANLPANIGALIGTIIPTPILTTAVFSNAKGRAVVFSNNVRVAIPTTATRLEPFFVAGGGIADVRHSADFRYTLPPILGIPGLGQNTVPVTSSSLGLALTLGGGLGIKATSHLWIDADLRLIRILGDDDQNVGRFGAGVRYRF